MRSKENLSVVAENSATDLARRALEAGMSDDEAETLFLEAGEDFRKSSVDYGEQPHKARIEGAEFAQAAKAEWDRLRSQS